MLFSALYRPLIFVLLSDVVPTILLFIGAFLSLRCPLPPVFLLTLFPSLLSWSSRHIKTLTSPFKGCQREKQTDVVEMKCRLCYQPLHLCSLCVVFTSFHLNLHLYVVSIFHFRHSVSIACRGRKEGVRLSPLSMPLEKIQLPSFLLLPPFGSSLVVCNTSPWLKDFIASRLYRHHEAVVMQVTNCLDLMRGRLPVSCAAFASIKNTIGNRWATG